MVDAKVRPCLTQPTTSLLSPCPSEKCALLRCRPGLAVPRCGISVALRASSQTSGSALWGVQHGRSQGTAMVEAINNSSPVASSLGKVCAVEVPVWASQCRVGSLRASLGPRKRRKSHWIVTRCSLFPWKFFGMSVFRSRKKIVSLGPYRFCRLTFLFAPDVADPAAPCLPFASLPFGIAGSGLSAHSPCHVRLVSFGPAFDYGSCVAYLLSGIHVPLMTRSIQTPREVVGGFGSDACDVLAVHSNGLRSHTCLVFPWMRCMRRTWADQFVPLSPFDLSVPLNDTLPWCRSCLTIRGGNTGTWNKVR
ncbi:hypothetical protein Lal_00046559 [Lupinus albus]|nr:hypothetical protein Lal_00046559 [Lupinus albus]